MQPYQEASREIRRQGETPLKLAGTAASIAGSAAGAGLAGKILPLLSKYIPENLAVKGLSKIDPRLGKFLNKAMSEGYDFDEVKGFIENKVAGQNQSQQQKAPQNTNIISQYSDELYSFLDNEIKKGRQPLEAGALAQLQDKYKKIINKMEQDHKSPFSSILESVFGSAQQPQQPQQPQNIPDQQSPQGQPGGDDQIIAALQKILSM